VSNPIPELGSVLLADVPSGRWQRRRDVRLIAVPIDGSARDALVREWLQYARLATGTAEDRARLRALDTSDPLIDAEGDIGVAVGDGGSDALNLVVALAEAAPDGPIMWFLGAGHVEVLITAHGDDLIDEIERCASQSERFRVALGGAWLTHGWVSPDTEARLSRFVTVRGLHT
jgi:hypothetical protein